MNKVHKLSYAFTGDKNFIRYAVIVNSSTIGIVTFDKSCGYTGTVLNQSKKISFATHVTLPEAITATAQLAWTGHKFTDPTAIPGKTKDDVIAYLEKREADAKVRLEQTEAGTANAQAWRFAKKYA